VRWSSVSAAPWAAAALDVFLRIETASSPMLLANRRTAAEVNMTTSQQIATSEISSGRAPIQWIAFPGIGLSAAFYAASSEVASKIKDFAAMPTLMTGSFDGRGMSTPHPARESFLRQEPRGKRRIFVNDLNGTLHIFDVKTVTFTGYLDLNGNNGGRIFRDITTSRTWICTYDNSPAADKSSPHAPVEMYKVQAVWGKPGVSRGVVEATGD